MRVKVLAWTVARHGSHQRRKDRYRRILQLQLLGKTGGGEREQPLHHLNARTPSPGVSVHCRSAHAYTARMSPKCRGQYRLGSRVEIICFWRMKFDPRQRSRGKEFSAVAGRFLAGIRHFPAVTASAKSPRARSSPVVLASTSLPSPFFPPAS